MTTLRSIIIDDNEQGISVLSDLLNKYFKDIEIVGTASSVEEGVDIINRSQPDIVFLDIEMPGENGTALFDYISEPSFDTIFTTAFEDFAAQAFRLGSIDYLLKPIKASELKEALQKVRVKRSQEESASAQIVTKFDQSDKITFSAVDTVEIFTISNILYCKAENNYTNVVGKEKKALVSKTLGYYESLLESYGFMRIDRSYLVNLSHIGRVDKANNLVHLIDGITLPFSGRRKKELLDKLIGFC